jgi:hypothetical protein
MVDISVIFEAAESTQALHGVLCNQKEISIYKDDAGITRTLLIIMAWCRIMEERLYQAADQLEHESRDELGIG